MPLGDLLHSRIGGRPVYYNFDGTPCETEEQLMEAMSGNHKHVEHTILRMWVVSTVFLCGIDHSFSFGTEENEPPILFETMAFHRDRYLGRSKELLGFQLRYSTVDEAKVGHGLTIEMVRSFNRAAARKQRFARYMRKRAGYPRKLSKKEIDRWSIRWDSGRLNNSQGPFYEGWVKPGTPSLMSSLRKSSKRMMKANQRKVSG